MPQSRFRDTTQSSRGKFDNLHRTPAEFTALDFDGYGLCCHLPTRPASTASYSVSVRQVTALLHASLEPCLTATLLRFTNTSPPSGCVEDLHLQVAEHARHTNQAIPGTARYSVLCCHEKMLVIMNTMIEKNEYWNSRYACFSRQSLRLRVTGHEPRTTTIHQLPTKRGLYRINQYKPRIVCTCVTAGTSDTNLPYQPHPHILLRNPKDALRQKQWGPPKFRLTVPAYTAECRQRTPYLYHRLADCFYRRNQWQSY